MQEKNHFFATARPTRLFFMVALPGMVSMLAMTIYSIIEGAFIGHLLGEAAFAAVNLAIPFVMINFSLADLVGVGSSVPISIALGRGDRARANNFFSCSLVLIFSASVFMGILLFFTSPYLVLLMGAEGELADLAVKYVRVYALLGPVTTIVFAMDNYLRICGFVKISMGLNIFMSLLTIGLLSLFLGLCGMNVEGSALATSISMSFCAVLALIPFFLKKTVLSFTRPRLTVTMLREIAACGSPVFLNNIAGRVASIIMNSALLRVGGVAYGQTAVAAYSVLMYASDIIQPMLYGMSDSLQPAIGYNWGAKSLDRVRDITKCSFIACGVVSVIGTVFMYSFSAPIASVFVKAEDTALMEMAVHAMKIFCIAYLFRWFGFAVQGFYSAIERPLPASILSVSSAMILPILFVYVLSPMGLDGLWLNLAATSLVVTLMAVVMLRLSQRSMKRAIERPAPTESE
ncbi:MAG: MATE family efflux transporter [Clostridia bacterium]|nr:MATE family efflux transporter [Clostridia bacterium]